MNRKKYFLIFISLMAISLSGSSVWAEEEAPADIEIEFEEPPSEIEMWEYLNKDAVPYSGLKCGLYDDDGILVSKKVFLPKYHRIDLDHPNFLIHTSKKSPSINLSDETREYLRKLLASYDEKNLYNFFEVGIVNEWPSAIEFNWVRGSTPDTILRDMYRLKKELEKNAPDLVIISGDSPCQFEEEDLSEALGTVSIGE